MVALRRTDDGGRTMGGTRHWRGATEYSFMDGEEENGRKERGDGQDVSVEQGARTNLGGGEDGRNPNHIRRET